MNIRKKLAIIVLIGATSLFAVNLAEIENLANKIKTTDDLIVKQELIIELNKKIEKLDTNDANKAQSIIDSKLIPTK